MSWTVDGEPSDNQVLQYGAPSPDELGRPIADSFLLARTDDVAVWTPAIRVYSTGCVLEIEWRRRRLREDPDEWSSIEGEALESILDYLEDDDGLRISISTDVATRLPEKGSGSFRSNDDGFSGRFELWLSPVPSDAEAELVCSWARRRVPETRTALPVAEIASASANTRSVWARTTEMSD